MVALLGELRSSAKLAPEVRFLASKLSDEDFKDSPRSDDINILHQVSVFNRRRSRPQSDANIVTHLHANQL